MMDLSKANRDASASHGHEPEGGWNPLVPELEVSNLTESLRFWCDLLGFDVAYDRPSAKFAYLQRDGAQIMLCQSNGNWLTGQLEYPFGRGMNIQIVVQDLEQVLIALGRANWLLYQEPFEAWYQLGDQKGSSREFLVQDPDGYLVRMTQNLGRWPAKP